jgi:DNA ligase D-like protein (predicted ligase)
MAAPRLPEFVEPMLALPGAPFDSAEHLFEVKWDGTRSLCLVESTGLRLVNRRRRPQDERYPELAFLGGLEPGLALDGEIVLMSGGLPDFSLMLKREQAHGARRAAELARAHPATYVAFDLLYRGYESRMERPLAERRAELAEVLAGSREPLLVFSDGVVGAGLELYEQVTARGIEGIVAKRLASRYQPGERTGDWVKIKPRQRLLCVILGYLTEREAAPGGKELRSLVIAAADDEGRLRCVGRVGSGLDERVRRELLPELRARPRTAPLVPCDTDACWVEPGLFCTVSFLEKTKNGTLRAPVFVEWTRG